MLRSIRQAGGKLRRTLADKLLAFPPVAKRIERQFPSFDMTFTDVWQDYLLEHHSDLPAKMNVLCQGMDAVSEEIARTVAERYFHVAPRSRFDAAVCYRPDRLFTQYERDLQRKYREIMRERSEARYWLPSGQNGLSISVFAEHNGLDFIPQSRQRLRGAAIIDGGAFIGDSALVMSEYEPAAIYCFEPDAHNCQAMAETISHNHLRQASIVNCGLGSARGTAGVLGHNSETKLSREAGSVEVTTIDDFCRERGVSPALIKLDVEGMESEVIEGALDTIQRVKPILIISVYHNPRDFFDIKPKVQKLGQGYQFQMRRLDPFHPTNETVLLCY